MERLLAMAVVSALAMSVALADNPQAEEHNKKGKDLYAEQKYADALIEFNAAVAIDPLAKYYFNVCAANEKLGNLQAALDACISAQNSNPPPTLKPKIDAKTIAVKQAMGQGPTGPGPTGPGPTGPGPTGPGPTGPGPTGPGPTGPGPTGPGPGSPGPGGPGPGYYEEPIGDPMYRLSGGIDLGVAHNSSISPDVIKRFKTHDVVGVHVKGHIDYMFMPKAGLGVTGWLAASVFRAKSPGPGQPAPDADLQTPTLGGGLFYDFKLGKRLTLSGMGGAALAFIGVVNSEGESDNFTTLSIRLEGSLKIKLAPRHAIVVTPLNLDIFLPAFGDSSGDPPTTPEEADLDRVGATYAFTIGYLGYFGPRVLD